MSELLSPKLVRRRNGEQTPREHRCSGFNVIHQITADNHLRLYEHIGNIPAAEAEARDYAQTEGVAMAACPKPNELRKKNPERFTMTSGRLSGGRPSV
ncbi:hypothetical protein Sp245p_22310 (plasmid) [Azospirillum baldaniorum]|uniref:Uncharacterized protein n=1 Tax=Azospirillum baldaniorum TaxID=1064539 RepID=A0A9P1JWD9_9PROT|nr:hypothetical protein [Azospirillum baldaniorum]AWJ92493.1 hypothetical protein Sp245p_22310 [Azospirillum baldaniorum]NUB09425.1 hypothetical protein [Azospirillum baldaniorum]TWA75733.1 hypothetical protein FBZ85_1105 [Azospirillum brasilense]CCD01043.1 protein of unknown function [Azospirillum baldaniorum]